MRSCISLDKLWWRNSFGQVDEYISNMDRYGHFNFNFKVLQTSGILVIALVFFTTARTFLKLKRRNRILPILKHISRGPFSTTRQKIITSKYFWGIRYCFEWYLSIWALHQGHTKNKEMHNNNHPSITKVKQSVP